MEYTSGYLCLFGYVCHVTIFLGLIHVLHFPRHAPARCLCAACSRCHVCCCPRGCRSRGALCIFHRRCHVARSSVHSETLSSAPALQMTVYAYTPFYSSRRKFKPRSWNSSPKTGRSAGLPQRQLRRLPSAARHSHTSANGRLKNPHRIRPSLARRVSSRRPKPPTTAFLPLSHNLLTSPSSPS